MQDELGSFDHVGLRDVTGDEARRASRHWWDAESDDYLAEHGADIGDADFLWCPEGLREDDARLLGDPASLAGLLVLEVGCGSAPVSRWLAAHGAHPVGLDLSGAMLRRGAQIGRRTSAEVPLVQADAVQLPFASEAFDLAVSSFGAIAFVADPAAVMREVARVLRPGGRWVFSTNHPMRWVLPDSPYVRDLRVRSSYFDDRAYVEADVSDRPVYVETHRTMSQRVRDILAAGLVLDDLVEPEWVAGNDRTWGQWSPERGALVPGTVIFSAHKPA
ncbi:methyltransferase domain-containing protein [Epidermidibacterium keratini]|uniref:Methyltransferase domain-containing protein n=1 Tax=Epidermidibacterium keratini TaxID=1891644 RepID=A0A7L4YKL7_9ACTN|nr:class I SAM-dependent methyltransferase [Epidermidibacterium keratini]QHB99086.1 methyltransferase domain-containing protein [Epidermidibacterium keratini]